ncbi:hypothetical protein [Pseudomonas lurida]|uniref:hypothetical protein n=1 Tax=Pseudomonas lurida TaxID=244566 RepID=UPI001644EA4D|nr:hypothetical protein [Pseudomonas lurida]MBC3233999.1 hypothetical protein [Pseudomonas lurida]
MTEPTRVVDTDDVERALQLTEAAGRLIVSVKDANVIEVQNACNSTAIDLLAYAKELIKTPTPAPEEPLI